MRGLALVLVLAACGNDAGLLLDVHPGDNRIVRVDVLLPSTPSGHNYMGLPPSPSGPKVSGPVFPIIDKTGGTVDSSGELRVLLTPGTQSSVPALLVLGYDASDTPIRYAFVANADGTPIDLPSSTSSHLVVDLEDITTVPVMTAPAASSTSKVLARWSHTALDDASADCFAILYTNTNGHGGIFFGPADDLDCDGASPECDNTWYDKVGSGAPTRPDPCVSEHGATDTMDACRIGMPVPCTDNIGSCKAVDPGLCVPYQVCHECGGEQDMFDDTCWDSAAAQQDTLHVECSVPVMMNTSSGDYALCNANGDAVAGLDLATYIGATFVTTGDNAFVDPGPLFAMNSLPLNGSGIALTLSATQPMRGVSFDIVVGPGASIDASLPPTPSVLAVSFAGAANESRELLFPFVAAYVPDCSHPPSCRIVTGVKSGQTYTDTMWHCVGR